MTDTVLDVEQIKKLLPHRAPMLLVEKLADIVPNESATGYKAVSVNEPWFQGHFPERHAGGEGRQAFLHAAGKGDRDAGAAAGQEKQLAGRIAEMNHHLAALVMAPHQEGLDDGYFPGGKSAQ